MARKRAGFPGLPGLLGVSVAVMALALAACGADPTATPAPTATPLPEAAPTLDAAALFQIEWAELIEAAQAEGEIVMTFGGSAGRNFRPIAEFWAEKFGITPVIATGSGGAHVERILAEQTAGQYLVDVHFGGNTSTITRLVPAGALNPVADLFIHPEVIDQSLWAGGKHSYSDPPQQFVFAFAANASPNPLAAWYNTDLVTQEDIDGINSVFDYLVPKWQGKIIAHIPIAGSGGTGSYYLAYAHPDIGREWVDRFISREMDVTFSNDQRFIVDGITKGVFALGVNIGGGGRDLDSLATLGAPVKELLKDFKEGGEMSSSSSVDILSTPTNPPNPNAAKLWVNWWLSKEGQTLMHTMSEVLPDPTLRVDVTEWGKVPDDVRRKPGREYYSFATDPQFLVLREEALAYAANAYKNR